jgi:putative colanic acid biosynthesis acetyltransferase WcaF
MLDLSKFDNSSFVRGVPRWKEALWWLCRSLLFAPWFPVPSALKVAALRFFGARVGQGVVIRSRVNITMPWRVEIGDQVWIGDEVLILSLDQVKIGSNVCLSQRAFLCTGNHDFRKESFDLITRPIEIGEGSWIAACAFVGPGAVVGLGTMVRAGEVWKNVPSEQGSGSRDQGAEKRKKLNRQDAKSAKSAKRRDCRL